MPPEGAEAELGDCVWPTLGLPEPEFIATRELLAEPPRLGANERLLPVPEMPAI